MGFGVLGFSGLLKPLPSGITSVQMRWAAPLDC